MVGSPGRPVYRAVQVCGKLLTGGHTCSWARTSGCVTQLTAITPRPAIVRWTCSGAFAEARLRLSRASCRGMSALGGGRKYTRSACTQASHVQASSRPARSRRAGPMAARAARAPGNALGTTVQLIRGCRMSKIRKEVAMESQVPSQQPSPAAPTCA